MIRVLHVITSLEVGGAQRMLVKLCERIDRARFACEVVSLLPVPQDGPSGGPAGDLAALGVAVESLGMRAGLPDPRAVRRLARRLAARPPDVVQSWLYHADLVATAALRRRPELPLAWNLRCTYAPGGGGSLAARVAPRLCAWASRRPRVIVTNSLAGRRSHEALGYRPRAWRLIPNGFDLQRLRPDAEAGRRLRRELALEEGHVLIGMLARFHPMKEHSLVLSIAAELARELPEARFVLAGTGVERGSAPFERAFAAAGSPTNVVALGERRDVPALAAGFDVLLSASSRLEGFPNALGEALACGTPCVATDVGDCARVLGEGGTLVPVGDRAALTRALTTLVRAGAEARRAIGARGREHVREHFELGRVARAYEELYGELTGVVACAV